jgi:hypothetical protein
MINNAGNIDCDGTELFERALTAFQQRDSSLAASLAHQIADPFSLLTSVHRRQALEYCDLEVWRSQNPEHIEVWNNHVLTPLVSDYRSRDNLTWVERSVIGNFLFRHGREKEAIELFGYSLTKEEYGELPTWTMGMPSMAMTMPRIDEFTFEVRKSLSYIKCPSADANDLIVVIGASGNYLPFLRNYIESAPKNLSFFAVINTVSEPGNKEDIEYFLKLPNLGIALDTTDAGTLDKRNKKGYYTFLRYYGAALLRLEKIDNPVLITDVDARFKSKNPAKDFRNFPSTVGVLDIKRWARPWLRYTAPALFVNRGDIATSFILYLASKLFSLHTDHRKGEIAPLWGADQAAIMCSHLHHQNCNAGYTAANIIPIIRNIIKQSQEFTGRESKLVNLKYI